MGNAKSYKIIKRQPFKPERGTQMNLKKECLTFLLYLSYSERYYYSTFIGSYPKLISCLLLGEAHPRQVSKLTRTKQYSLTPLIKT